MAKKREEIEEKFTWDLTAIYPSDDSWDDQFHKMEQEDKRSFPTISFYKDKVSYELIPLLKTYFSHMREIEKLYTYAHLKHDQDVANSKYQAFYKKITALLSRFQAETAWIEPSILELPQHQIDQILELEEAVEFRVYLRKIALMKDHVLNKSEEKILALASYPLSNPSKVFSLINNADMKFHPAVDKNGKSHELTHGSYSLYLKSHDRNLRKTAFENIHKQFLGLENSITELLVGSCQQHHFFAKTRKYNSCLEAALFPNQIDTKVYENLIATVTKNLKPLHHYLEIRKKHLKLDELNVYDLFVPLVEEVSIHFDYENTIDLVLDSLRPLGDEYISTLKKGLIKERWVDVYENQGKRSGAYSSGCYDSFPYLLLNYQGTFSDVMTFSHEIGHSMHSYFSNQNQAYQNASYSIFVAEVASTFNEELTFRALLAKAQSKKERIYLLSQKIDSIRSTLFRQTLFAEFELLIHQMIEKHEPVTAESLKKLYLDLNEKYYGKNLHLDPLLAVEYLRIPHFYYNFYVYQYATGISAAYALAEKVLTKQPHALESYLNFLKSGSSEFPINLLKKAGIDMHRPDAIESLIHRFDTLVKQLEKEFEELD